MRYILLSLIFSTLLILLLASGSVLSWTGLANRNNLANPSAPELVPEQIDLDLLIKALIKAESDNNTKCRGRHGEKGLLQIRPRTWRWVCKNRLKVNWNFHKYAFDRTKNIAVGRAYFEYLLERFASTDSAICAYNCGPVHYLNNQIPPATLTYLKKVKELYKELENSSPLP